MSKEQFRTSHRLARIAARRANKATRRAQAWAVWASGMALLRAIHNEMREQFEAMDKASLKMENIRRA